MPRKRGVNVLDGSVGIEVAWRYRRVGMNPPESAPTDRQEMDPLRRIKCHVFSVAKVKEKRNPAVSKTEPRLIFHTPLG